MSKFKAGDKVQALKNLKCSVSGCVIEKNKVYECLGRSDYYPEDMIKIQDKSGKMMGWNENNFELVQEKEKHYKHKIIINFDLKGKLNVLHIEESEHYVSPDKIEDYIIYLLTQQGGTFLSREWWRLEDKFVEE